MQFKTNHMNFEYYTLIKDIKEETGRHYIVLERADFYVESGGQPSDHGTVAGHEILSIHEISGVAWHEVAKIEDLFIGMRVKVEIDEAYRLELSREHTGQHLLSAILDREYNLKTVGFHIGEDTATIDTDAVVSDEILEEVGKRVLQAIASDVEVTAFVESSQTMDRLGLRKEVEIEGDVQIIRIGDLDFQACCGTHVDSTADLLFFLIRKSEKKRTGSRIYFQFGQRALDFALEAVRIVQDVKEQLEIHETEIPFRVRLLKEQTAEDCKTISELRAKLAQQMLLLPQYGEKLVYEELDEEEELIRVLSFELARQQKNSVLLDLRELKIYGNIFKNGISAGALFRESKIPGIRGGGGPTAFQGVADSISELLTFGRRLETILEERLNL
ncbi:MAG: alanyl-tRNA editing protein [Clostridiaceae bacterium]